MDVLVVEDDPSHCKLVSVVLLAGGNTVRCAETAEETFEAIRKSQPQVILLDLALPGTDGLVIARKLRSDPTTGKIPIVAVTAYPDLWSRQSAKEAGCEGYLLKPLNTRTLERVITEAARGDI